MIIYGRGKLFKRKHALRISKKEKGETKSPYIEKDREGTNLEIVKWGSCHQDCYLVGEIDNDWDHLLKEMREYATNKFLDDKRHGNPFPSPSWNVESAKHIPSIVNHSID